MKPSTRLVELLLVGDEAIHPLVELLLVGDEAIHPLVELLLVGDEAIHPLVELLLVGDEAIHPCGERGEACRQVDEFVGQYQAAHLVIEMRVLA